MSTWPSSSRPREKWLDKYNAADNNNVNEDICSIILEGDWNNMLIAAAPEGTLEEQDAALLASLGITLDLRDGM